MKVLILATRKSFLFGTIVTLMAFLVTPASTLGGERWTKDLGRADHIAYIVLDELRSGGDTPQIFPNDFNLPLSTFYKDFKWGLETCWAGSVLKEGVRAYCLPYARLGKYYPNARNPSEKFLNCMGSCAGLYVWHVAQENKFYFWATCWNVSGVLGPFLGDPKVELPQAVKTRRGQRTFPGVTLSMLSQRWFYPNAEDARVPRDEHYDCAHGHMSGRGVEMLRLNTFFTSLRLANRGARDIYYQTESPASEKPAICQLIGDRPKGLEHAVKTDHQCDIGGDNWRKLKRGEVIEFEVRDQAYAPGLVGFVLLLNEEPNYWDPGKLLGTYLTMPIRN